MSPYKPGRTQSTDDTRFLLPSTRPHKSTRVTASLPNTPQRRVTFALDADSPLASHSLDTPRPTFASAPSTPTYNVERSLNTLSESDLSLSQVITNLGDLRLNPPRRLLDYPEEQSAVLQSVVNAYLAFKADYIMSQGPAGTRPGIPGIPALTTNGLPSLSDDPTSATQSPARGKEMKNTLLHKLRPPSLTHVWDFWHDRQDRAPKPSEEHPNTDADATAAQSKAAEDQSSNYEDRLVLLHSITDVSQFWKVHNNFDLAKLKLRDTIHLFHRGVKPVWEDPRNVKGGSWTFRVPKEKAEWFWREVCMLAIGEALQAAVDNSNKRLTFIDDICGISYSVRFNSILITVWNRDAEHKEGIERLKNTVLGNLPEELQLPEKNYYYKKHSEHAGFRFPIQQ